MQNSSSEPSYSSYSSYQHEGDNTMGAIGPLGIVETEGAKSFTNLVNQHLIKRRKSYSHQLETTSPGFLRDDYRIDAHVSRLPTGEGIARFNDTVRGHDIFIFMDAMNYSVGYNFYGNFKPITPDEHYQDLKRMILATSGKARRINVIMPFLYEGRQHRRSSRESLDCAYMLEELERLGVTNVITFDAHDPRVSNATPISGFENIPIHLQLIQAIYENVEDIDLRGDDIVFIAPDEGAIDRVMYFSNLFHAPLGTFYKLRDYTKVIDGKNPILAHDYLGDDVSGKDVIIIDDMISSGGSMLDVAKQMKQHGARRVLCCATFGLFTSGLEDFDNAYDEGYIDFVFGSNLIYRTEELLQRPWWVDVDCSKFVALIIDALNHDASMSNLIDPTDKIKEYLDELETEEAK